MILRFMDKFPDGYGTYFEEKLNHIKSPHRNMFVGPRGEIEVFPKIHTIRKDELNRWKPGMSVQGYYHARTKRSRKIFDGQCVSVQSIKITYRQNNGFSQSVEIQIDKKVWMVVLNIHPVTGEYEMHNIPETIYDLIINDGLTPQQFFKWFNVNFEGKIIHFTDLKY